MDADNNYLLVCTIISGDVTRQHAINDIANVTDFLENNAHLQGVRADIMQVCAQPQEEATTIQTGGASEMLANRIAEASLSDPEAVVQDPLILWPVQVYRREAKKMSAELELHQEMCRVNASEMHNAFPSLNPLQLQAILQCSVCAACKMHRRPFKAVPAELKTTGRGAVLSMDLSYWITSSPGGAKHLFV